MTHFMAKHVHEDNEMFKNGLVIKGLTHVYTIFTTLLTSLSDRLLYTCFTYPGNTCAVRSLNWLRASGLDQMF